MVMNLDTRLHLRNHSTDVVCRMYPYFAISLSVERFMDFSRPCAWSPKKPEQIQRVMCDPVL